MYKHILASLTLLGVMAVPAISQAAIIEQRSYTPAHQQVQSQHGYRDTGRDQNRVSQSRGDHNGYHQGYRGEARGNDRHVSARPVYSHGTRGYGNHYGNRYENRGYQRERYQSHQRPYQHAYQHHQPRYHHATTVVHYR